MIKNYLKSGTKESSMRAGFLIITILTAALVGVFIYVLICQANNPQFPGYDLAALLGAISALYGAGAYMKKEQRKYEHHKNDNDINTGQAEG